jgi:hypothetical protein
VGDTRLLLIFVFLGPSVVSRSRKGLRMLVELGVMEQRYRAVLEVLEGAPVTKVARRYGVARQTVHGWLRHGGVTGFQRRGRHPTIIPRPTVA